jgi:hypothetical protein
MPCANRLSGGVGVGKNKLTEDVIVAADSGEVFIFVFDGYCFDGQHPNCLNVAYEHYPREGEIRVSLRKSDLICGKRQTFKSSVVGDSWKDAQTSACVKLAEWLVEQRQITQLLPSWLDDKRIRRWGNGSVTIEDARVLTNEAISYAQSLKLIVPYHILQPNRCRRG